MVLLLTGFIFAFCGFLLYKFPPGSINGVMGYRTPMAMKNKDTWDEAQRFGGLSMIILGFINLLLGIIFYFVKGFLLNETFQLMFMLIGTLFMLLIDEKHLRKIFNKDGSRKK
ncbi:SdpI family protein [uncultured Clostridium sp.]|uniref:SdpI family protein n=1 Tax=uncultured Clostridium sp. TaxID=59620 RepID=UPI00280B8D1C|nr:SdpI family protein [uncultured Clostridium sp.]